MSVNLYVVLSDSLMIPAASGIFRTEEEAQAWIDARDDPDGLHVQAAPLLEHERDE